MQYSMGQQDLPSAVESLSLSLCVFVEAKKWIQQSHQNERRKDEKKKNCTETKNGDRKKREEEKN